jgi:hypothetical protein
MNECWQSRMNRYLSNNTIRELFKVFLREALLTLRKAIGVLPFIRSLAGLPLGTVHVAPLLDEC